MANLPPDTAGYETGRARLALRLANVHVDELGALDAEEVERALRRDRLGQQRLACAWPALPPDLGFRPAPVRYVTLKVQSGQPIPIRCVAHGNGVPDNAPCGPYTHAVRKGVAAQAGGKDMA